MLCLKIILIEQESECTCKITFLCSSILPIRSCNGLSFFIDATNQCSRHISAGISESTLGKIEEYIRYGFILVKHYTFGQSNRNRLIIDSDTLDRTAGIRGKVTLRHIVGDSTASSNNGLVESQNDTASAVRSFIFITVGNVHQIRSLFVGQFDRCRSHSPANAFVIGCHSIYIVRSP